MDFSTNYCVTYVVKCSSFKKYLSEVTAQRTRKRLEYEGLKTCSGCKIHLFVDIRVEIINNYIKSILLFSCVETEE